MTATRLAEAGIEYRERLIRRAICGFILLFGVVALGAAFMPGGPASPSGRVVVVVAALSTVPASVLFGRSLIATAWRPHAMRAHSAGLVFVVYADVGILAVLTVFTDPRLSVVGATLFAPVSAYAAHFCTRRAVYTHAAVTSVVVVGFGIRGVVHGLPALTMLVMVVVVIMVVNATPLIELGYDGDIRATLWNQIMLANTDPLTGLLNRRGFEQYARDLVSEDGRSPLAVLFVDIDDYKGINDRFGHAVGDTVLSRLADRMTQSSRASLAAGFGRTGGDEFAWVGRLDEAALGEFAEHLRRVATLCDDTRHAITVSIGGAVTRPGSPHGRDHAPDVAAVLAAADRALYAAKASGKNTVVIDGSRPTASHH